MPNMDAINNVIYFKQAYENAKNSGKGADSLKYLTNQAQNYYSQLDPTTAGQLKGMNASQAANWYSGMKNPSSSSAAPQQAPQMQQQQPQQDPYGDMMNNPFVQMMMQEMSGLRNSQTQYAEQMAAFQQQQQEAMRNQYNSLLGQYEQAQGAELGALERDYEASKAQLEDDSFQQYLRARQAMANKGLAGSGLANDQDTRLLMANSRNLAGMNNTLLNNKASVKLRYGSQMDNIRNALSSMSPIPLSAGGGVAPRSQGVGAPQAPDTTILNYMSKMLDTVLPYTNATVKDQMGYDIDLRKVQHDYDKLSSEEQRFYDKLGTESQIELAKLAQKNDLELTKLFGVDKNGNVTLDAKYKSALIDQGQQKIDVDKWYKGNKLQLEGGRLELDTYKTRNQVARDWENVRLRGEELELKLSRFDFDKVKFSNQQDKDAFNQQMGAAKSLMNSARQEMQNAYTALTKSEATKNDQNLIDRYNGARQQYEIAYRAVDDLAQLGFTEGARLQNQTPSQKKISGAFDKLGELLSSAGGAVNKFALGSLSRNYESGGDPGTIARNKGDIGGASYGMYQLATTQGTPQRFVDYLKNVDKSAYNTLSGKKPGTPSFDRAWKNLAKNNKKFGNYQHDFIRQQYFEPAVSSLKKHGIDVSKRSKAVQDAVWSTAVQHGTGNVSKIFRSAGITSKMSDSQIIQRLYKERGANNGMKYFPSSSPDIRAGVVKRFQNEMQDALKMLS